MPFNPAAAVRGPKHVVKGGKTPILSLDEARALLDGVDASTLAGLRDRALIALMIYSFARVGAATAMRVEDVFTHERRLWVRLNEKGGKRHEMPCHHNLEAWLHAWLETSGLAAAELHSSSASMIAGAWAGGEISPMLRLATRSTREARLTSAGRWATTMRVIGISRDSSRSSPPSPRRDWRFPHRGRDAGRR